MDNTFAIDQIKTDLYRSIVRMEKCVKRMCEVQAQKPNDYNNDETYQEADCSWHLAYFDIYHVTTTGRKNSVAWNDMVDMTEYEIY